MRRGLLKGLEQAGDTRLPSVVLCRSLEGALLHLQHTAGVDGGATEAGGRPVWGVSCLVDGSCADGQARPYQAKLAAHPHASRPLLAHIQGAAGQGQAGSSGRVLVAVGPEGGWQDAELELLAAEGFEAASLGQRILSTTSAVVLAAGLVQNHLQQHAPD